MKKIFSVLLCAVLLLGSFSVMPVSAAGETGGIDYSLILDLSGGASYPVQLNFDGLTFDGTISRSGVPNEEREKIIDEVLEQMKLTREDIGNAHKVVDLVRAKKSWGEILQETRKTFEKMLGVPDIVDVVDSMYFDVFFYDGSDRHQKIQQGLRESEMTAYQISVPEAASAALSAAERIAKLKGKQILTELFSLGGKAAETPVNVITTMWDAMRADQKTAAEKTASYAMREIIYEFYNEVNRRIRVKDWKNDWNISINDVDGRDFSFVGVNGCRQTFAVDMSLTNKGSSTNSYPNGIYKGTAQIVIEHEMSPFDSKLKTILQNGTGQDYTNSMALKYMNEISSGKLLVSGFGLINTMSFSCGGSDRYSGEGVTTITRKLTKEDFTVEITGFSKDNNFNVFYPHFDGFTDDLAVSSSHCLDHTGCKLVRRENGEGEGFANATFIVDGPSGDMDWYGDYSFLIGDDERVLYVYCDNPWYYDGGNEGGRLSKMYPFGAIWDYSIWDKWDSENKYMTVDLKNMK